MSNEPKCQCFYPVVNESGDVVVMRDIKHCEYHRSLEAENGDMRDEIQRLYSRIHDLETADISALEKRCAELEFQKNPDVADLYADIAELQEQYKDVQCTVEIQALYMRQKTERIATLASRNAELELTVEEFKQGAAYEALVQCQRDLASERERRTVAQEAITTHWEPTVARLTAQRDALREALKGLIAIVERWWRFDSYQQPLSSWHDREDCLIELRKYAALAGSEQK